MAFALAALTGVGDALRISPLAMLGGGLLIATVAVMLARREDERTEQPRHSWSVAVFHGVCWAAPALWAAWVLEHGMWTHDGAVAGVALAAGAVLLGLLGRFFEVTEVRHERRAALRAAQAQAAEIERAASAPEAIAARAEQEALAQWRYWIYVVGDKLDTEIIQQVPWEGDRSGYGYDAFGRLPGRGATLSRLAALQEALEVHAARHGGVFAVEILPGQTKADFVLAVATADALAEEREYPVHEIARRSINDPVDIGFYRDGSHAELWLRVATLLLQGKKRSGKSNTMLVGMAGICQTEDALNFVIDINKKGTLASPWVRPWLTGLAPVPGVDWVAADWPEARRMTEFVLHLLECRQVAYQELMFAENDDQLRVRAGIPKIVIWMDEVAEVLGTHVKPVDPKVADNIATIIRVGGQMGVDVYLCGLRVTSDVIPQQLTTQAGAKISMRVDDSNELSQMFDYKHNLSLTDLTYQGCGFVWQDSGRPRVFRAWRLTPNLIEYIVRATASFRSTVDLGIVSDHYREMYEKRWERVLPVMFPHMFSTGHQTLPAAGGTGHLALGRPDTGPDSTPDTGPVSGAAGPDTGGRPGPDSAGAGDDQEDVGSLIEIADALRRLAGVEQSAEEGEEVPAPAEPTGEEEPPAGRPALRLLLQVEDDGNGEGGGAPAQTTASKINDRERSRRAKDLIAAALIKAEFTGLTIEEIGELCERAGLGASQATYYRWADAVAPGSPYGSYVHPQWRRSG